MKNDTTKKVLNIVLKVVTWILIAFTVFMMVFTIITTATVGRNDRSIFGFRFYTVLSDSMSKSDKNADMDIHFNAGDIVIIGKVKDATKLKAGDVIAFISSNDESYGETVTHMIREVKRDETTGELLGYVTFGTNTGIDDEALVEPSYVLGEYSGKLPGFGWFFNYVKTTPGYIIFIFIPFVLLILYNGMNVIVLFRKYKKQQTEIIEAEKAEIAAERKQNEEMLKELQALKAQLEQKAGNNTPTAEVNKAETDNSESNKSETDNSGENNCS